VVAIIGVETRYGKNQGTYKVMESLSSLAFEYPPRAEFFKSELEQYLLLCREQQFNPLDLKGSYAGAMGLPQFISSSYRHYAVDFAGHGHADLLTSPTDAIGSVANYFKMHGWKKNQPVAFHASVSGKDYSLLLADRKNPKPIHPANTLQHYGISFKEKLPEGSLVALVELEQPHKSEYWLALDNFYVITRYNHSSLYAMAVYQLSEQIKQRYHNKK
jgi:membrane-bound lytic murein transglycosylase B